MAVKAKSDSGVSSGQVGPAELRLLPARRRRQKASGLEYERARISEVQNRAAYYELRVERLLASLLSAAELRRDMAWLRQRIREIVMSSPLSKRDKADIDRNLEAMAEVVDVVAAKQNENEPLITTNGEVNGGGDLAEG
jgi:hypothetical protein